MNTTSTELHPEHYLTTEVEREAFLQESLNLAREYGDMAIFQAALRTAAKATSVGAIADKAGISRTSLYKTLQNQASPKFDTVCKVLTAMDMQLRIEPAHKPNADQQTTAHKSLTA